MSRLQRKLLISACIVGGVVLCAAALLPALALPSNCGGNSAALNYCRRVYDPFRLAASNQEDNPVSISEMSAADRDQFRPYSLHWIGDAKILVTRAKFDPTSAKQIIAVCDTPYDNVPRGKWIFSRVAPLTHAVAYSDGSVGLLPVEEFRRLDKSTFVDVRTIPDQEVDSQASPKGAL